MATIEQLRAAQSAVQDLQTREGAPWLREVAVPLSEYIAATKDAHALTVGLEQLTEEQRLTREAMTGLRADLADRSKVDKGWLKLGERAAPPLLLLLAVAIQLLQSYISDAPLPEVPHAVAPDAP